MVINANTKISALIRANPAAIDAIASINAHFKKLQNPVLRKIFASRVTIGDAAKIGKCDINTFFKKLQPLGFTTNGGGDDYEPAMPASTGGNIEYDVVLDVRDDISAGQDPFRKIMQAVTALPKGKVLLLINSFEPLPLICILKERGYAADVVEVNAERVDTYFRRIDSNTLTPEEAIADEAQFNLIEDKFRERLEYINVRQLPMPQPMIAILKALDTLESGSALYVYHKKLPLFLLPELKERQYHNVVRHTDEGVELIIYKQA